MATMKHTQKNMNEMASRKVSRRHGATIVEFALILPVLIAMLLGIMEFGWLVKNNLTIANAAREGARAAALGRTRAEITARVENSVKPLSVTAPDGLVKMYFSINNGADNYPYVLNDSGTQNSAPVTSLIKITVSSKHRSLTSFFPFLSNRNVEAYATMRREVSATS